MAIQISKAIFIHTPKTGGTWVTEYFRETGMSHNVKELEFEAHIGGGRIREIIGHTEDLCFCFVRHPLTWYRSYWQHKTDFAKARDGILDNIVDLPFLEFMENILQNRLGFLTGHFRIFTERCRFVGKQENLRRDLNNVLKYLRIPYDKEYLFKKPLANTTPSSKKYPIKLALDIMEAEKGIINEYNYNYIPLGIIE
jgi:hypothetical protein